MAVLFKTWRERVLGRFLLESPGPRLSKGLTGPIRQENRESGCSGREPGDVWRNNPFFVGWYHADLYLAVGHRNFRCIGSVGGAIQA